MSAKAFEAGVLQHWSPSQIKTLQTCPRRWAAEKVFRLPVVWEETPKQAEGTLVHNQIETWGKEGVEAAHPLALLAIDWLGPNTDRLRLWEAALKDPLLFAADIPAKAFIDHHDFTDANEVHVVDFKTRTSFDYAPTEEQLRSDVQMVSYSMWAINKYAPKRVKATHLNLRTGLKRPKAENALKAVSVTMTREDLIEAFRPVDSAVRQMKEIAETAQTLDDVSHNASGATCWAFGKPCPFMSKCKDAVWFRPDRTSSTQQPTYGVPSMSEVERIKEKVRAKGINPPDAARYTPEEIAALKGSQDATTSEPPAVVTDATPELVLFIDCLPEKGEGAVQRLEDLVAPAAQAIAEKAGVPDLGLVEYGKGPAALRAFFTANPPSGLVTASNTGNCAVVLEVLKPLAKKIIRGIR